MSNKVSIMQPYLFPYIGYYQLVKCSDVFVIYDDANYIKNGYINKNFILSGGKPQRFTVPVVGGSSNKKIKDLYFDSAVKKTLRTIQQSYAGAPFVEEVYPLVDRVLSSADRSVRGLCHLSIVEVLKYLGLTADIRLSSDIEYARGAERDDKILSMCAGLGADHYINSIGGQELYSKEDFDRKGFDLSFIKTDSIVYNQGGGEFVPNLSIIDVLMWCSKAQVLEKLNEYTLI